jgi:hypothetical protein
MPDSIKQQRAANAKANVSLTDSNAADSNYTSIFTTISPTIIQKAVKNADYRKRYCYDTAANRHVFNDHSKFVNYVLIQGNNVKGLTSSTAAVSEGIVRLHVVKSDGTTHDIYLAHVLYCPNFATNVISQAPFKRKGAWYHLGKDKLYNSTDEELAYLLEIDGIPNFLVVADPSEAPAALSFASLHAYRTSSEEPTTTRTADEWHQIFGHANMDILKRTAKAVKGMVISTNSLLDCPPCGLSKSHKVISRKPQDVPNTHLSIVHVDIVGPISPIGRNGELYWMLITSGKTG